MRERQKRRHVVEERNIEERENKMLFRVEEGNVVEERVRQKRRHVTEKSNVVEERDNGGVMMLRSEMLRREKDKMLFRVEEGNVVAERERQKRRQVVEERNVVEERETKEAPCC